MREGGDRGRKGGGGKRGEKKGGRERIGGEST